MKINNRKGLFRNRVFKVTFPNYEAMHEFERDAFDIEGLYGILGGVPKTIGGFEDGHWECVYPVLWNKVRNFKLMIGRYNMYAEIFSSKYSITGWEAL